jgi:DNA-binding GntR family transcriptional regulator
VDPSSDSRPPYVVVAEQLRARIAAGEFAVGDQLPSGRELAAAYRVAPNTVLAAIRALREEGIVASQQGRGTFVRDAEAARRGQSQPSSEYEALTGQLRAIENMLRDLSDRVRDLEQLAEAAKQPHSGG